MKYPLEFHKIVDGFEAAPLSQLPSLLGQLVQICEEKECFKPGGLVEFVQQVVALKSPKQEPVEIYARPECPFNYCSAPAPHDECRPVCQHKK